ncbi:electron transporter RsxE [Kosmotoga arenicorallina S304]|uniref:Ion-translocating oxidoreductase complex subunit E n=1 Tax=Kosmotoga arenicorallina S304 TaxID=1453497 RepID=A0A176K1S1_9BACT|nr:electron transport complex subunit E [Kosmotoga arenicorallina]OAA30973.1 electron transporter RsxE [Kosmotoga arenicorallina S304]
MAASKVKTFTNGFIAQNPIFAQVLGMCPTLATTTSAGNGLGMGLATTSVLVMSNVVVSLIRKFIPEKIRIPAYIVIIASFVTIVDLLMHGFTYELWKTLGLFIPLIVVNCIILGRAESFASKNSVGASFLDGLGMGLGFTGSLVLLGSVREFLGNGSIFGFHFSDVKMFAMILPPGAYIALGVLAGMFNFIGIKKAKAAKAKAAK